MTHPVPESLVPYALGEGDSATARHVERCSACRAEVARLREGARSLRAAAALHSRTETASCLEELTLADFVDGRLGLEARGPVVHHLLMCARCRGAVRAASHQLADAVLGRKLSGAVRIPARRRWLLPLGLAAAAALLLLLVPRYGDDGSTPGLRDTNLTIAGAPFPIAPRGSVARVDRVVWSSVPRVERYRLRLYTGDGDVLWTTETTDTSVTLPKSVVLSPHVTYFWKVEAQTEWKRWVASDLVAFLLGGPSR